MYHTNLNVAPCIIIQCYFYLEFISLHIDYQMDWSSSCMLHYSVHDLTCNFEHKIECRPVQIAKSSILQ